MVLEASPGTLPTDVQRVGLLSIQKQHIKACYGIAITTTLTECIVLAQDSGSPDSWKDYIYEQNGGRAKWIGPDPTHIKYDTIVTTTNGVAESTTDPIDVSVQSATATAADGSYQEPVLLSPNLVAELTNAAQQACPGKRRKRDLAACILSNAQLQNTATNLITLGMAPEELEAAGAVSDLSISLLKDMSLGHLTTGMGPCTGFSELKWSFVMANLSLKTRSSGMMPC